MRNCICITIFGLILSSASIDSHRICNTASNRLGKCVSNLENMHHNSKNDSACDVCQEITETDQISECITPNNDKGACVRLDECPVLENSLSSKPFSKIAVRYLTMSGCKNFGTFLVCCSGKTPDFTVVYEENTNEINNKLYVDLLLPSPEQCAFESSHNKMGVVSVFGINSYPWMAQIEYRTKNTKYSCSAILISKRYLITPGHCVDEDALVHIGEPINVRIGEVDDISITIPIEEIILHPRYFSSDSLENSDVKKNDIALIRIKNATPFTDFIKPICLPNSDLIQTSYNRGLKIVARLQDNTKNLIESNIQDFYTCKQTIHEINSNITLWYKQICAKLVNGNELSDLHSGNALLIENYNKYYLMGISNLQNNSQYPSVFTKIYPYVQWIKNSLKP